MKKRKYESTKLPPIPLDERDILKALLNTPPPPPGDPSTRKQKPKAKKKAAPRKRSSLKR